VTVAKGQITPWGPVPEKKRIVTLDAIRGVALFGILLENISLFAFPVESVNPVTEYTTTADQWAAVFRLVFVDGKFYPLFCILFGMGIALQSRRAEESEGAFARTYIRRLVVLMLIGVAHGLLFFSADILAFYAVVAFAALPFRKARPKSVLVMAFVFFLVSPLMMGGYAVLNPENPTPAEPDWHQLLKNERLALQAADESAVSDAGPESFRERVWVPFPSLVTTLTSASKLEFYEFMADEQRIFQTGTFVEMVWYRAALCFLVFWPLRLIFLSWGILALFLLGVYFAHSPFFDTGQHRRTHQTILFLGFFLGIILQVVGGAAQGLGSIGLSLSYASGVTLICARTNRSIVGRSLVAAGRTALTNYLGQSVVCGFFFYSYGLGLFGQLTLAQAVLLAVPIFVGQLIFSTVWLRFFQFGPMEWVWRTLTYWRIQPMRRS
jgi:uncharacterized protein